MNQEVSNTVEQEEEPRNWKRVGVLVALQPFSWAIGVDRSQWRAWSLDLGPFRFTVAWP